jgi:membrane-associated phospholipid phosphatase
MDLQHRMWSRARVRIGLHYSTSLLAAMAVAAAVAAAPTGITANQQSCSHVGVATQCQSPGDVEINSSPSTQSATPGSSGWPSYPPAFSYASPGVAAPSK